MLFPHMFPRNAPLDALRDGGICRRVDLGNARFRPIADIRCPWLNGYRMDEDETRLEEHLKKVANAKPEKSE